MTRRSVTFTLSFLLSVSILAPAPTLAVDSAPLPASMAAVGDSITRAASSGGTLGADYPQNSWSTGSSSTVNSHYLRLLAAGAPVGGNVHNLSVSGAKVGDLNGQMLNAVEVQPDYLTVLIGGNDLCTDTVAEMTSVQDFRSRFAAAMGTLAAGSPETFVYVVSIPDVHQLWQLFRNNWWARFIWSTADICQSLLQNPTSTQQADVERRAAVRQRNIDYNVQLAEICAQYAARCHFDGNAVFNTKFTTGDVSGDYFHPSIAGQAKLASVSWAAGYAFGSAPAQNEPPTASFTSSCSELTCTFTDASADADGSIVARTWSFGDGATSGAVAPSHTYAGSGTYRVDLTVTDDDGATASATASVTVTASTAPAMWVADLNGSAALARNSWTATVTILVADASGPLSGVAVFGSWSAGSGAGSCTTGSDGACAVTSSTLNKRTASVTYEVGGLSRTGWIHDPDADVQTSVTVTKP